MSTKAMPAVGATLDAFPPEIELSRAVDRLAREPERVGDWSMVLEAFAKVDELKTGAQLMHLGAGNQEKECSMSIDGYLPPGCTEEDVDRAAPGYYDDDRPVRCEECGVEWAWEEINMGPWCRVPCCPLFDQGEPVSEIEDMEDVR